MAANSKYRFVYVVCGFLEVLLFGGLFFGWGSLLFVLQEDGVFHHLCHSESLLSFSDVNESSIATTATRYISATTVATTFKPNSTGRYNSTCSEQDSMLSLTYTIGSVCLSVGSAVMGHVNFKFGTRVTRLCAHVLFLSGALLIAFTSRDNPWLIMAGLPMLAVGGITKLFTDMQFSVLFVKGSNTVVGLLNGAFDCSTAVLLVVKGVALRWQMMTLAGVSLLTLVNTFLFLPTTFIYKPAGELVSLTVPDPQDVDTATAATPEDDAAECSQDVDKDKPAHSPPPPLRQVLRSPVYWLHVLWGALVQFRISTYFGLLNPWLEELASSKEDVSSILNVTFYVLLCAVITTPAAGWLNELCKRPFAGAPDQKRRDLMPFIFPLTLTSILGTIVSALGTVQHRDVIYPTFAIFVIFRSFLYSTAHGYIVSVFRSEHIGVLIGLWNLGGGVIGLLQYGLLIWAQTDSTFTVNRLLTVVTAASLVHPFYQWWSARRQHSPLSTMEHSKI